MITMRNFYQRLLSAPTIHDPLMHLLLRVTRANAADVAALSSGADWYIWTTGMDHRAQPKA